MAEEIAALSGDLHQFRPLRNGAACSLQSLVAAKLALTLDRLAQESEDLEIARLTGEVNNGLKPAGHTAAATMIDRVAEVLDATTPSVDALVIYIQLLGDLPTDLLDLATQRIIEQYRYANFPRPADWFERIKEELRGRKDALILAKLYQNRRRAALLHYPSSKLSESPRPRATVSTSNWRAQERVG